VTVRYEYNILCQFAATVEETRS